MYHAAPRWPALGIEPNSRDLAICRRFLPGLAAERPHKLTITPECSCRLAVQLGEHRHRPTTIPLGNQRAASCSLCTARRSMLEDHLAADPVARTTPKPGIRGQSSLFDCRCPRLADASRPARAHRIYGSCDPIGFFPPRNLSSCGPPNAVHCGASRAPCSLSTQFWA